MTEGLTPNAAEQLFLRELETIDRAIRFACRRGALHGADAEDFASLVKLRMIDKEYAIVRKHDGQSSFAAYVAVIIQRTLLDYRIAQWGKWHASAEAKRLGEQAITLEAMLYRDRRTIDEIYPSMLRRWPDLTRAEIDHLAASLPARTRRPRAVDLDLAIDQVGANGTTIHDAAFESERIALSGQIDRIVRSTMNELNDTDRMLFRLRFEAGLSIAAISRMLHLDQKPLYRRLERALLRLRGRLEHAGITAKDASDLLALPGSGFDFGFARETSDPCPSSQGREES